VGNGRRPPGPTSNPSTFTQGLPARGYMYLQVSVAPKPCSLRRSAAQTRRCRGLCRRLGVAGAVAILATKVGSVSGIPSTAFARAGDGVWRARHGVLKPASHGGIMSYASDGGLVRPRAVASVGGGGSDRDAGVDISSMGYIRRTDSAGGSKDSGDGGRRGAPASPLGRKVGAAAAATAGNGGRATPTIASVNQGGGSSLAVVEVGIGPGSTTGGTQTFLQLGSTVNIAASHSTASVSKTSRGTSNEALAKDKREAARRTAIQAFFDEARMRLKSLHRNISNYEGEGAGKARWAARAVGVAGPLASPLPEGQGAQEVEDSSPITGGGVTLAGGDSSGGGSGGGTKNATGVLGGLRVEEGASEAATTVPAAVAVKRPLPPRVGSVDEEEAAEAAAVVPAAAAVQKPQPLLTESVKEGRAGPLHKLRRRSHSGKLNSMAQLGSIALIGRPLLLISLVALLTGSGVAGWLGLTRLVDTAVLARGCCLPWTRWKLPSCTAPTPTLSFQWGIAAQPRWQPAAVAGALRGRVEKLPICPGGEAAQGVQAAGYIAVGYDCPISRPLSSRRLLRLAGEIVGPCVGSPLAAPLTARPCVLYSAWASRKLHEGVLPVPVAFSSMNVEFVVSLADAPEVRVTVEGCDVMLFDMCGGRCTHSWGFAEAPERWQDFVFTHKCAVPCGEPWTMNMPRSSATFHGEDGPLEFQECVLLVGAMATLVGELCRDFAGDLSLRPLREEREDDRVLYDCTPIYGDSPMEPWRTSWECGGPAAEKAPATMPAPTASSVSLASACGRKVLVSDDPQLLP